MFFDIFHKNMSNIERKKIDIQIIYLLFLLLAHIYHAVQISNKSFPQNLEVKFFPMRNV